MDEYALISIIMPSYNCAYFIGETIDSILAQTYQNWELLITDDCSTDNSREIISRYASKDPRIKLLNLAENSGAGIARNNSIKEAKGRFIAFCDSDDRWMPEKLEKQISFMERENISFSSTSYITCDEENRITGIVITPKIITFKDMCSDDRMGFLTCIYDANKLGKIYLPALRKRQDWALKIKILQKCKIAKGLVETLGIYRLRSNSLSNNKKALIKYNIAVYREVLEYSNLRAWLKFIFDFMPHYLIKRIRTKIANG